MSSTGRSYSTTNAGTVLAILKRAGRALSAYQLLDSLKGSTIKAPNQVYRALHRLQGAGAVHRVHSLNAFVACSIGHHEDGCPGLMICDHCGAVIEFAVNGFPEWLSADGFAPQSITLEVAGLCASCRTHTAAA